MAFKIAQHNAVADPAFAPPLEAWLWKELAKLQRQEQRPARPGAILGCPLWGDKYIDRFKQWCVPSLLSPRNAETLRHTGSHIVLLTDEPGFQRLWSTIRLIESYGISVITHKIPAPITERVGNHPNNKYWLLGMAQNQLVRLSAKMGQGFSMLMPDHIYCDGYWGSLFRFAQVHDAIAQNGTSVDIPKAEKELESYRQGAALTVPARDLGDIGWRHLHAQMRAYVWNNRKNYCPSHFMIWKGEDRLWIYSPHANAAWMSNKLCLRAPIYGPASMDSELPAFMPDGAYMPGVDDEMVFVEVSDADKPHHRKGVSEVEFLVCCWSTVQWREHFLPWFKTPTCVPTRRGKGMTEEAIRAEHGRIYNRLVETGPKLKAGLQRCIAANEDTADFGAMLEAAD